MDTPLTIFPILMFFLAILSFLSGIGVFHAMKHQRGGKLTTFVWAIFSGSISMGFVTFGLFIYITRHDEPLAIGVAVIGMVAVLGMARLASL